MDFRSGGETRKPLSLFSHSSLTDIVLLLLIFFLLTSSFVANFGIKVNIPKAESGTPPQNKFVTVVVTKDKEFFVEGKLAAQGTLASMIREEHQKNPGASLVLRADKAARVDDAVRVMNIAKALNIKVLMATERGNS